MAIDDIRGDRTPTVTPEGHSHTGGFIAIAIVLALLVIGQIYNLNKLSALRSELEAQIANDHRQLTTQLSDRFAGQLSQIENANAQDLAALKSELDNASKRAGSTGSELRRARAMVAQLQQQQEQQGSELKRELAQKADEQQLGALSQDVTTTKSDLSNTKQDLDKLAKDLGMARSQLGTLIATNHDEIEALRKLGERDYYELTLSKNLEQKIAGVGLILRKTNVKRHKFSLDLLADDMAVRKDNRTVDEPIFFSPGGNQKKFYELVVNKVDSNQVTGYISTPKGAIETASASSGGTQ